MNREKNYDSSKKDAAHVSRSHPVRIDEPGQIHFVTTSCQNRKQYFADERLCEAALDSMNRSRQQKGFLVIGYVIMPEHCHWLLVPGPNQTISQTVGIIKWSISMNVLKLLRERGSEIQSLWMPRFYDFNIVSQRKLNEKLHYCHMNPVTRGLVTSPEEWKFSSFRNYECNDDSVFRVDRWWEYWQ